MDYTKPICALPYDRYRPEVARYVIDAIAALDEQSVVVSLTLALDAAIRAGGWRAARRN